MGCWCLRMPESALWVEVGDDQALGLLVPRIRQLQSRFPGVSWAQRKYSLY